MKDNRDSSRTRNVVLNSFGRWQVESKCWQWKTSAWHSPFVLRMNQRARLFGHRMERAADPWWVVKCSNH